MGKPKKQVKCTLCTQHRWKGNRKDRFKDAHVRERMKKEIKDLTHDEA